MIQAWRNLLFLHFAAEPDEIQRLLPKGLDVDVFPDASGKEMAWIGFVPFLIDHLTFRSGLRIATAHRFLETNVRTYVHRAGRDPAVWFFSLDAASSLACLGERASFGLPYWPARMSMEQDGSRSLYQGQRRSDRAASYRVKVERFGPVTLAEPGALEFFLAERYLLYSSLRGRLHTGRVHHSPYPLQLARILLCEEGLTSAAGVASRSYDHAMYSSGVDVEVFTPRLCI